MDEQSKYLRWLILIAGLTFGCVVTAIVTITEYNEYLRLEKFIKLTGTIQKNERLASDRYRITFSIDYQNRNFERSRTIAKELKGKQITIGLNPKNEYDFFIYGLEENHLNNAKDAIIGFFIIILLILLAVIFKEQIGNLEDNLFGHSS